MKHFFLRGAAALLSSAVLLACHRTPSPAQTEEFSSDEIVFTARAVEGMTVSVTKADAVTELSQFYASAVTGDLGQEQEVWTSVPFSKDGAVFKGGKWWPSSNPGYAFYASNLPLRYTSAGAIVDIADNSSDVVCAFRGGGIYRSLNRLTFYHVFARLGNVNVSARAGYTISNVDIRITPNIGGSINLTQNDGAIWGEGWSSLIQGSPVSLANATPGTKSNDLYLVPGTYRITASWKAVQGDYQETFSGHTTLVDIPAGSISELNVSLGGKASEMQMELQLENWNSDSSLQPEFEEPLTMEFTEDGALTWTASSAAAVSSLYYSTDAGSTWNTLTSSTQGSSLTVHNGDVIQFVGSGNNRGYATGPEQYNSFGCTAQFYMYGNISSLLSAGPMQEYAFYRLFAGCNKVRLHADKEFVMPSSLSAHCFEEMFKGCTRMNSIPALTASELADYCYAKMFEGCTGFAILSETLPAQTVNAYAYSRMFAGCTSLWQGPSILCEEVLDGGLNEMYQGCSNLARVTCTAITFDPGNAATNWMDGVRPSGLFTARRNNAGWTRNSASGVPSGWSVVEN